MPFEQRNQQLTDWLTSVYKNQKFTMSALSGDAGFRKYYRLQFTDHSVLCVDAPPEQVNNLSFIELAYAFARVGVLVPKILHYEERKGFICITDFGDTLLSEELTTSTMSNLYQQVIDLLPSIGKVRSTEQWALPVYDQAFLQMEMDLFEQWFLNKHLDIWLSPEQKKQLQCCFDLLLDSALQQPQQGVHRDFHSRNLLLTAKNDLAVIDFQDAVQGPITYDLVSLLRDCYVKWDDKEIEPLLRYAWQVLVVDQTVEQADFVTFCRWFDLMGLQRHIKVAGIFSRLHYRDNKSNYLNDIPLTLSYIYDVSKKYAEFNFLSDFLEQRVFPRIDPQTKESIK